MATKKTKRRAKSNGSAFPVMSDLLKSIEDNFRALAAMVPTGTVAKPKRKAARRNAASRSRAATKRAAAKGKRAVARGKKAVHKVMPKKAAAKRSRRADKRPSAASPV